MFIFWLCKKYIFHKVWNNGACKRILYFDSSWNKCRASKWTNLLNFIRLLFHENLQWGSFKRFDTTRQDTMIRHDAILETRAWHASLPRAQTNTHSRDRVIGLHFILSYRSLNKLVYLYILLSSYSIQCFDSKITTDLFLNCIIENIFTREIC